MHGLGKSLYRIRMIANGINQLENITRIELADIQDCRRTFNHIKVNLPTSNTRKHGYHVSG